MSRVPTTALGRPVYADDLASIHRRLRERRAAAMIDDGTGVRLPARTSAGTLATIVALYVATAQGATIERLDTLETT